MLEGIEEMFAELSGYQRYNDAIERWSARRAAYFRECAREQYRERQRLRRCLQCGSKRGGTSLCENCKRRSRERYATRRRQQLCGICGEPSMASRCERCSQRILPRFIEQRRKARAALRAQGLCIECRLLKATCGCNAKRRQRDAANRSMVNEKKRQRYAANQPVIQQKRRIRDAANRAAINERQQLKRATRRADGRCITCGSPSETYDCESCLEKRRKRAAAKALKGQQTNHVRAGIG